MFDPGYVKLFYSMKEEARPNIFWRSLWLEKKLPFLIFFGQLENVMTKLPILLYLKDIFHSHFKQLFNLI
jgi:hypothetical protein